MTLRITIVPSCWVSCAECHVLFVALLSVIMLSVVMLIVIMLGVHMLIVIMLGVNMLSVVAPEIERGRDKGRKMT